MELLGNRVTERLADPELWESYYRVAETTDWLNRFWGDDNPFRPMFETLDLSNVVELACGCGRHTAKIIDQVGHITLVDTNPVAMDECRTRFSDCANVTFVLNSGHDLKELATGAYTALFSYDAMVHFEPKVMISYIDEIARILSPGGKALLHYSNYDGDPEASPFENRHWRNFFSERMMRAFASRAGFSIVRSVVIPWEGTDSLDAVTLLAR